MNNDEVAEDAPMTVTIELRPEIEAGLANLAAAQGVSLPQYLRRLLEEQVPGQTMLSSTDRAAAWRESVKALPRTRPLSDEAISRDSIYDTRG